MIIMFYPFMDFCLLSIRGFLSSVHTYMPFVFHPLWNFNFNHAWIFVCYMYIHGFLSLSSLWWIPLTFTAPEDDVNLGKVWMSEAQTMVALSQPFQGPLIVNAQKQGFYR
jgi:hypothetical protein